jgi:hypothetical protein
MSESKRSRVAEGDLVAIDVPDGAFVSKVIFASAFFRDVILLAVYPAAVWERDRTLADREPSLLVYTSGKCIGSNGWRKIGFEPVTELEQQRSRRIVGGGVWLGDEELGPATNADRKSLPKMLIAGCKAVELQLQEIL